MDEARIREAARVLAAAFRDGARLDGLPAQYAPRDVDEAHAIQDAMTRELGELVAGWKVSVADDGAVQRAPIFASRTFKSPAVVPATLTPLLAIESEIAFRFDRDLPQRSTDLRREEFVDFVSAFAGIEVVDSRFSDRTKVPTLDCTADLMTNGAYVVGSGPTAWQSVELGGLEVVLTVSGCEIVRHVGGHAANDPLSWALKLANSLARRGSIPAGTYITAGTFTGLQYAAPGDVVTAEFVGFGKASLTFTP
jgi:2-keto-4-pentenoate hydratase